MLHVAEARIILNIHEDTPMGSGPGPIQEQWQVTCSAHGRSKAGTVADLMEQLHAAVDKVTIEPTKTKLEGV